MNEEITCPRCRATASLSASKCPACAYEFGPNTKQEAQLPRSGNALAQHQGESSPKPPLPLPIKPKPNFAKDAELPSEVPPQLHSQKGVFVQVILAGCLGFVLLIVAAFTMCVISMGA